MRTDAQALRAALEDAGRASAEALDEAARLAHELARAPVPAPVVDHAAREELEAALRVLQETVTRQAEVAEAAADQNDAKLQQAEERAHEAAQQVAALEQSSRAT